MRLDTAVLWIIIAAAAVLGLIWIAGVVFVLPFGFVFLLPAVIVLALLGLVIRQRLTNREDDYYDKNVDR